MKASSQWIRRAVLWGATGAVAAAVIVAASSAEAAHTTLRAGSGQSHAASKKGPGYPAPKGIYKPFTNCPLLNPLMQESTRGNATGCVAGIVNSGTIKIGNITTKVRPSAKVKYPVVVQFGIWDPPNAANQAGGDQFTGGILPPPNGLSAQLVSIAQYVPGGLLKALGCPSKNRAVEKLCSEASRRGGKYLKVYASAESAGPITGFDLTTWLQPSEV